MINLAMPRSIGAWLAVLGIVFAICAVGITRLPVIDRDEARFAQASKQMAETGDFIDIRLQEGSRYKKPVGIYWLHNVATFVTGAPGSSEIWRYRLVSVLAATLCVPALAWAGAPLVGAGAAMIAGLMLVTTVVLQIEARIAKTDAALLLMVILAMGVLARAALGTLRGWAIPAIFWTALGMGVLIKGPLILAPVAGTILWVGIARRGLGWLAALRPMAGLAWAVVLVAPWYIAITLVSEGQFWVESLGRDFAGKIAQGQESHAAPPGSYLLAMLLTAWPWVLLVPLAAVAAWRLRYKPEMQVMLGWLLPFWLVLELVPTKLPHYTLPGYPALMLLAVLGLVQFGPLRGWACALGVAFWVAGALALAAAVIVLPWQFGDGPSLLAMGSVAVALAMGLWGLWDIYGRDATSIGRPLFLLGGSSLGLMWSLIVLAIPAADQLLISPRLAALTSCHEGPIILGGYAEPSAPFLLGTDIIMSNPAEARRRLAQTPGAIAWLQNDPAQEAIAGEGVWITGTNYSNGQEIALRLYHFPDRPAQEPLCP